MSVPALATPCHAQRLSVQSLSEPDAQCAPAPWQRLMDDGVYTQQEHDHYAWRVFLLAALDAPDPALWPRAWTTGRWPKPTACADKIAKFFWLALRDGQQCRYCTVPLCACNFTIDHLTPTRRGGTNAPDNLGLACLACNAKKGKRTEAEFLATVAV